MFDKIFNKSSFARYLFVIIFSLMIIAPIVYSSVFPSESNLAITLGVTLTALLILSYNLGLFRDIDLAFFKETRKNSTIQESIKEIHNLFIKADYEVRIVTGSFNEKIWGSPIIVSDFKSLIDHKVKIQIITGNVLNVKANSDLYHILKDNIDKSLFDMYYTLERPLVHFVIVDNMHVRLEQKHDDGVENREALIKINDGLLANRADMKFRTIRQDEGIPITKKNFDSELIFTH